MDFDVYIAEHKCAEYRNGVRTLLDCPNAFIHFLFRDTAEELFLSRVMPEAAWSGLQREILGIQDWDPYIICRITHGRMMSDQMWIKFPDDPPSFGWKDVI